MVTILLPQTKHSQPLAAADIDHELVETFERIAIVGWVSCGQPIDMFTQQESIEVPSKLVRKIPMLCAFEVIRWSMRIFWTAMLWSSNNLKSQKR